MTADLDGQDQGISSANEIDSVRWLPTNPVTGVTEIYWADICREDANSGFRLQETVSWAQSVVDRVRDMSSDKQNLSYELVRSIFSELGHGLQMLGRFLAVAPFLGLPEVEIKTLLTQYLGDVQYVTEFRDIRNQIIKRFEARMASIKLEESDEIIIISHSEGTVVSFLGLLTSLSRSQALPNDHVDWRKRVAGLVTLGSPIDKHIIIWQDL